MLIRLIHTFGKTRSGCVLGEIEVAACLITGSALASEEHLIPDAHPEYLKLVNPVDPLIVAGLIMMFVAH